MTNRIPPNSFRGNAQLDSLSEGTVLYRVHSKNFVVDSFNPVPSHRYYGGGRFDATADDPYPYLYAGQSVEVALAETLLRDMPFNESGRSVLPRGRYAGRRISAVRVDRDIELVRLVSGEDLSAVAQTTWLTMCEPTHYAQSRHWAHWIRALAPTAAGYTWISRREPTQRSYVFFGDRSSGPILVPTVHPSVPTGDASDFDTMEGRRTLKKMLYKYNATVRA